MHTPVLCGTAAMKNNDAIQDNPFSGAILSVENVPIELFEANGRRKKQTFSWNDEIV